MSPRARRQSGFTLLELLLACALVAMITATLSLALHVAFRARHSALHHAESSRAGLLTLDRIGRDLTSALPPRGLFQGAFLGRDAAQGSDLDDDSLLLTNTADPSRPQDAASDLQQVTIQIIAASELNASASSAQSMPALASPEDTVLVRRVTRRFLSPLAETPVDQVLCRRVQSLNIRYCDGTQWLNSWDSSAQGGVLPVAVEVTLRLTPAPAEGAGPVLPQTWVRIYPLAAGVSAAAAQEAMP